MASEHFEAALADTTLDDDDGHACRLDACLAAVDEITLDYVYNQEDHVLFSVVDNKPERRVLQPVGHIDIKTMRSRSRWPRSSAGIQGSTSLRSQWTQAT